MQRQALVVEDNLVIRMQIADILTDLNMAVEQAGSAEDALALLSESVVINYLVADVGISGPMDGLTLAATVMERWPGTRIVIATGRELEISDVPDGAILLSKPFGMRALEIALDQAEQQHCESTGR